MKKILWLSKHKPLPSQTSALRELFGEDCHIIVDQQPFTDVDDIIERLRRSNANDIVLMAPLTLCRKLLEYGVQPLYAEMRAADRRPEIVKHRIDGSKAGFEFVKFLRLTGIDVRYEEVHT